jgi:phospholipid/cholesterol/gamma-HCH transport system substrate-binding protein
METRSNHIFVGGAVLALLAAVIAFTFWLAGLSGGAHKQYDIFFKTAVDGIAKGASVTFSGVPIGQVKDIALWQPNPEFVKVRIAVNEDVPVLQGTTASISSVGFTGLPLIQLQGAVKGAPPITENGPGGVPTIPTKTAGLGALLNNAPQLIERLSTLTERLTELVSDKNQASIARILGNVQDLTGSLASQGPQFKATLEQTKQTIKQAGTAADQITLLAGNTNTLVNEQGKPMLEDLRHTINAAQKSMNSLDAAVSDVRPGLQTLSNQTMPEATQLISDLRAMSQSLNAVASKLDNGGASALLSQPALPDYNPKGK